MKFRAGQKIVCVNEPTTPLRRPWRSFPKKGEIYTVRGYRPGEPTSVLLLEVINDVGLDGYEAGFWEDRFRPVVTRETDISCFKVLLHPKPEPVA